jgi:hypothetical protein
MISRHVLGVVALSVALIAGPMATMAQSQADKTGVGGLAAGQDDIAGVPIAVVAGIGIVAVGVGVGIAVSNSGGNNTSSSIATGTTTTTTTR